MNRRHIITALPGALLLPHHESPGAESGSKKKGWCGGNSAYHQMFRASWYYTWTPKAKPSEGCEFVPMIKAAWAIPALPSIRKMGGTSALLGFNEPSRAKQGNISVEAAIKAWPKIVARAEQMNLKIGSPSPTSDQRGQAWLAKFMEQAKRERLRVDFIGLHYYGRPNSKEFITFLERAAKKYRKPIWVTEFNGWSGSEPENYKFLKESLRFLERSRDIERYAYFNTKKGTPLSLLKADNTPSRLGELYRDT